MTLDADFAVTGFKLDALAYETRRRVDDTELDRRPAPCVGCEHRQRCASLLLACEAFKTFIVSPKRVDYQAPRIPTHDLYRSAFRSRDDDEEANG